MSSTVKLFRSNSIVKLFRPMSQLGDLGGGAGRGGGDGGSIRAAGGALGMREAAREGEYFYKKQKEQLSKLKQELPESINVQGKQIEREQTIDPHKSKVEKIEHP